MSWCSHRMGIRFTNFNQRFCVLGNIYYFYCSTEYNEKYSKESLRGAGPHFWLSHHLVCLWWVWHCQSMWVYFLVNTIFAFFKKKHISWKILLLVCYHETLCKLISLGTSILSIFVNRDQYNGQMVNNSVFTTSYKVKKPINLSLLYTDIY